MSLGMWVFFFGKTNVNFDLIFATLGVCLCGSVFDMNTKVKVPIVDWVQTVQYLCLVFVSVEVFVIYSE